MNHCQSESVRVLEGCTLDAIPGWVYQAETPLMLKGLVRDWPAVQLNDGTLSSLRKYLSGFWHATPVTAYIAPADIKGRYGYNHAFNGFNFLSGSAPLSDVFDRLAEQATAPAQDAMSVYVGSTPVDGWLPGFRKANDLPIPSDNPLVNFWLGNRTTVSAHYDFPNNIACVVTGRRQFTLFPTEQIKNLYVGPVDRTPSGQAISLVDFDQPNFEKYPRFADALSASLTCVCEAGDALFIPSMWWHHVRALSEVNMLINYWWTNSADYLGSPRIALLHAMMSIRDLPTVQRDAWATLFEHYVFAADEDVYRHVPSAGRGCLAPLNDEEARKIRAELINRLNQ